MSLLNATRIPLEEGPSGEVNFENLYPELITCCTIIMLGYISGYFNMISEIESRGINTYLAFFVLPALIFTNMVTMDMSGINYWFILAIFISKAIIFFLVMIIHLLVVRPLEPGNAGLLSIFATQSNDFAIGYPIVSALYKNSHPEFANYMYLLAPINLAILNPIAFLMIEHDKVARSMEQPDTRRHSTLVFIGKVGKNMLKNPIIMSTLAGIICNFIFHHQLPIYVYNFLNVLSSAFTSCALFSLGMRMVGNFHNLTGLKMMVPFLLILAKLLALPILMREIVSILNVGIDDKDTSDWSTFGFLYGTLPTAPTVFVFALQAQLETEMIATSMVACTIASAPWLFISAKMITITKTDPSQYISHLSNFIIEVAAVSLVASVWVLIVFIFNKKIKKVPHKFTACLILSQILSCIGATMIKSVDHKDNIASYIQFVFFNVGVYSCRIWTAIVATTLVFMQQTNLCYMLFQLQPIFMLFGWGLPIILTTILFFLDQDLGGVPMDQRNPNFIYGNVQAIISLSLLVLCFTVTAGCLILHEMSNVRLQRYKDMLRAINSGDSEDLLASENIPSTSEAIYAPTREVCQVVNCGNCGSGTLPTINESGENSATSPITDIEDLFSDANNKIRHETSTEIYRTDSGVCRGIIQQYEETIDDDLEFIEEDTSSHDPQIFRHTIMLICLLCSMFVGIAVGIWTLIMEKISGIYLELSFLDVVLNFGQSIIILTIFGSETTHIVLPLLKRWRKLCFGGHKLILPMMTELNTETVHICEQFTTHHLDKCNEDIASQKKWRLKTFDRVFSGRKLVDWLIDVGLARDRIDGVNYARHLIEGRVLRHINDVYHFYDKNLLYTFE